MGKVHITGPDKYYRSLTCGCGNSQFFVELTEDNDIAYVYCPSCEISYKPEELKKVRWRKYG